jgi:hypothetical protein
MTTTKTTYRITWVERDTRYAASLGLDETIKDSDFTWEEAKEAALYHGECAGVDLDRYEPMVQVESRS